MHSALRFLTPTARRFTIAFVFFTVIASNVSGQKIITGKIVDSKNLEPIANASVTVTGRNIIVTTDNNGQFKFPSDSAVQIAVFRYDYEKSFITVDPTISATIKLKKAPFPFENGLFRINKRILGKLKVNLASVKALGENLDKAPWFSDEDTDFAEIKNRAKYKVRTEKNDQFFKFFDFRGRTLQERYFEDYLIAGYEIPAGRTDSIRRNSSGNEVWISDKFADGFWSETKIYYWGDTLFAQQTENGKPTFVQIQHKGALASYYFEEQRFWCGYYKRVSKGAGYVLEKYRGTSPKNVKKVVSYYYDAEGRMVGWESSIGIERFVLNNQGLKIESLFFKGQYLQKKTTYKRDHRGLIIEAIEEDYFPSAKAKLKEMRKHVYEYTFY